MDKRQDDREVIFNLVLPQPVGKIITVYIHFKKIDSVFHNSMLTAHCYSSDPFENPKAKN